jgi:predicted porin
MFSTVVMDLSSSVCFNTPSFPKRRLAVAQITAPIQTLENLEMKKTLVALAALASVSAFAQSSVTLYGNLDQAVFQGSAKYQNMTGSNSNGGSTSLWGIKGVEDLGGGTRASFDLKSELTLATGQTGSASTGINTGTAGATTSNVFNRGAFISLANDKFGDFKIGRQNDAWWEATTRFNNTGVNSFGWANATAMASGTNTVGLLSNVTPNGFLNYGTTTTNPAGEGTGAAFYGGWSYETPKFNGLSAKYGKGLPKTAYDKNGQVNNTEAYSLNYTQGPVDLSVARNTRNDSLGYKAFENTMYGAAYTFDKFTLKAAYNKTRLNGLASNGHDVDTVAYGLGYQLNPVTKIDLGLTEMKDVQNSANKFTQLGVVGTYSLSKRTSVYLGYGTGKNTGVSKYGNIYGGNANVQPTDVGQTVSAVLTGIRHQF